MEFKWIGLLLIRENKMKWNHFFYILIFFLFSLAAWSDGNIKRDPTEKPVQTFTQEAEESAAREMGRVIGRKLGEEANAKISTEDQMSILERTRAAIRGSLLRKYIFSESPYFNSIFGYISILRIGKNQEGFQCKEFEMDLVFRIERLYATVILCDSQEGQWHESDAFEVEFSRAGELSPGNNPGSWLPPL